MPLCGALVHTGIVWTVDLVDNSEIGDLFCKIVAFLYEITTNQKFNLS